MALFEPWRMFSLELEILTRFSSRELNYLGNSFPLFGLPFPNLPKGLVTFLVIDRDRFACEAPFVCVNERPPDIESKGAG